MAGGWELVSHQVFLALLRKLKAAPAKRTKLVQAQHSLWIAAEVEGWIQPPGWLQQPGNVWMDLTERLEGLGPGPLPQDRECLIIFEVNVSQA